MEATIFDTYNRSSHRLFLLDYDGTLSEFYPLPSDAKPTKALLDILKSLGGNPKNTVVIISGRDHKTLEKWLGNLPLAFVAEHGFFLKEKGGTWKTTTSSDSTWKQLVRPLMENVTAQMPGTFIEEKSSALVWHYRQAEIPESAINQFELLLRDAVDGHNIAVMPGHKILEVKLSGFNKGTVAKHWLKQQVWDFILAAGDDTTDEDFLSVVPDIAFTFKIGPGKTVAKNRLPNPNAFVELLSNLR
jgi:trehalose 6-phosphate synthase/phosphatase